MAFTWTDPTVTAGSTPIRKVHIDEARADYKSVEGSVILSPQPNVSFTDPTITAGATQIRTVHINELRSAINYLETQFSGNCNCNNCCQSCQACQTYSVQCQSCQACQLCQTNCSQCTQTCQTCQKVSSDARLKDKIQPITNWREIVDAINGYRFFYNEKAKQMFSAPSGEQVGFVAQELDKVLPEAVGRLADTPFMSVNETKVVPVLLEAVKYLLQRVDDLEKKVK
jgi:hypothetical protein